jgi:flagellar transcriptional activator FlhD
VPSLLRTANLALRRIAADSTRENNVPNLKHIRSTNEPGVTMKFEQMMEEIREANLTYMLLAQQMIHEDREAAMFRLGLNADVADILGSLTPAQVLKMASSNMLLCRFRFDDRVIFSMLSGYAKDKERTLPQVHAAILMAGKPAEAVA